MPQASSARRLPSTGGRDRGVDVVIALDPLGLDLLYAQAKCYRPDNAIDVGLVRDFSGSLDDKKSARGVLMTPRASPGEPRSTCAASASRSRWSTDRGWPG